jgi:parvulin-like peptidyl-prolyl isomerase
MEVDYTMKRIKYLFIIVLLSIIFLMHCSGLDSDTIAQIGDITITKSEFKELLKNRYPGENDLNNIEFKKKQDLLDTEILKKLKVNAALDNGLDKDPEIVKAVKKQEENLLGQKFFEVEVVDKLITAEEIKEFIDRQGVELKASLILIGYDKSQVSKDRTKEEAMKIAEKALQELKGGKEFGEVALKYSDDPSVKRNKGEFGYFRWGQRPQKFQEACWNMEVGEISGIIDAKNGFNIIKLEDKKVDENYVIKNDPETIFRTKRTLYGAVADSGGKLWQKIIEDLRKEFSFQYYDSNINEVTRLINKAIKNTKIDTNTFSGDEKQITLAEWDDESIKFGTIIERYKDNLPRVMSALRDPEKFKREIENISLMSMAITKAKDMGLQNDPLISEKLRQFQQERLAYVSEQKLVNDKISFSDEEVKKYYDEHPEQFMNPAKMEIWSITVTDEAFANKIAKMAKSGSDFEMLAQKYSTDKYYKEKGGYLGFRTINSRGSISKKAFEMKPNGEISDPFKFKNDWAIIKTGELSEKKLRPFQDVSRMVEGRLRNDLLKKKRTEWREELKEKYSVKINEELLNNL